MLFSYFSVHFDIACLLVLHRSPSKPASHPFKQVPLTFEHSFTSRHFPHVSLQRVPYDPFTHSEMVEKHVMQITLTSHNLRLVELAQTIFFTNSLTEKRFLYSIFSYLIETWNIAKMNIVKVEKKVIKTWNFQGQTIAKKIRTLFWLSWVLFQELVSSFIQETRYNYSCRIKSNIHPS